MPFLICCAWLLRGKRTYQSMFLVVLFSIGSVGCTPTRQDQIITASKLAGNVNAEASALETAGNYAAAANRWQAAFQNGSICDGTFTDDPSSREFCPTYRLSWAVDLARSGDIAQSMMVAAPQIPATEEDVNNHCSPKDLLQKAAIFSQSIHDELGDSRSFVATEASKCGNNATLLGEQLWYTGEREDGIRYLLKGFLNFPQYSPELPGFLEEVGHPEAASRFRVLNNFLLARQNSFSSLSSNDSSASGFAADMHQMLKWDQAQYESAKNQGLIELLPYFDQEVQLYKGLTLSEDETRRLAEEQAQADAFIFNMFAAGAKFDLARVARKAGDTSTARQLVQSGIGC